MTQRTQNSTAQHGRFGPSRRLMPLSGLLLGLTAAMALAQPGDDEGLPLPPTPPPVAAADISWFAGEWDVAYNDRVLGDVTGSAAVRAGATPFAVVILTHPRTGKVFTLLSESIKAQYGKLEVKLRGLSPSGGDGGLPDVSPATLPAQPGATLTAQLGEATAKATVSERAELDRLDLSISLPSSDQRDRLDAEWSYACPGETLMRYGRAATYSWARKLVTGYETWRRVPGQATIHKVVVLDSPQPYPFKPGGTEGMYAARRLFVVGQNLPASWSGSRIAVTSHDPSVEYVPLALASDAAKSNHHSSQFAEGWKKLAATLTPEQREAADGWEAMLVRATLKGGVEGGPKALTLNGGTGPWLLEFSDATAELHFARRTREGEAEDTETAYLPERLVLEVRTTESIPVRAVPLIVGRNGKPVRLGDALAIEATPVAGKPRTFRSPVLVTYPESGAPPSLGPGELGMAIAPGDTLQARAVVPGLLNVKPEVAKVTVSGRSTTTGTLWEEALAQAALCYPGKFPAPVNWDQASRVEVKTISNFIITEAGSRSTTLRLRDHAAMLLLKQAFLETMREQQSEFGAIRGEAMLDAFAKSIAPNLTNDSFPFSRIPVKRPAADGGDTTLLMSLDQEFTREHWKLTQQQSLAYSRSSLEEALGKWRDSLAKSIARAEETADSDVDALLTLVSFGFEPVAARVIPRLMKPDPSASAGSPWITDEYARVCVRGMGTTAAAVRAQQDLSAIDTQVALLFLSAFPPAAAYFAPGWVAGVVAIAGGAVQIAGTVPEEVTRYLDTSREVEFAQGAAAVLGTGRLTAAEAAAVPGWQAALNILLASTGVVDIALGARELSALSRAARAGQVSEEALRAARVVEEHGLGGARSLAAAEATELAQAAEQARALRQASGEAALSAEQSRVLSAVEGLAAEAGAVENARAATRTPWGDTLESGARGRFQSLGGREDVVALTRRQADELQALVREFGPDALERLQTRPYASVQELRRDLERSRRAVREPVLRYGEQTRDNLPPNASIGPPKTSSDGNVRYIENDVTVDGVTTSFKRGYDPDTGTVILKHALPADAGKKAPAWIANSGSRLDPTNGTPTHVYATLHQMKELGVEAGKLKRVFMDTIANAETIAHLDWLRREAQRTGVTFDVNEAIKLTHSYQYAETVITQAGFRPTGVRVVGGMEAKMRNPMGLFAGGDPDAFLARYGLSLDSRVQAWFDIEIDVAPFR